MGNHMERLGEGAIRALLSKTPPRFVPHNQPSPPFPPQSSLPPGKRGRRNSVGSLDSTIEVSGFGHAPPRAAPF